MINGITETHYEIKTSEPSELYLKCDFDSKSTTNQPLIGRVSVQSTMSLRSAKSHLTSTFAKIS